ncbi:Putative Competence protein [Oceanicola granulosus HTCC2516]|uniref:Putative Competence protein n=1 Tax=Oceanicola granulosus (strain ATCC BAA-861 / DSM 15982 / KCTC 12143 / HTCC2516) TaxID=314256 RepID=Q2CG21_OCEGH|nr:Putative Competence protein [Oceanicola granulosus HTCC2516]
MPVCLGAGIGIYFALPVEPGPWARAGLAALAPALALAARRAGLLAGPVLLALALVAAGVSLASARAHAVAAPVLGFRYYGPVEGRVIRVDRSASDAVRLTLDRVRLEDVRRTPERVRVSLHGAQGWIAPRPGMVVILTGHLSPPGGPVEPGGFDFRRMAWFDRLGAVGYTRTPVLALAPPEATPGLWLQAARMRLSAAVQARVGGETGAFAAAIVTGDRSAMGQETLAELRATNLAHLLAISGLHMGMLTGFVFGLLRLGLAACPPLALRWPGKKIAAAAALLAGAGYLALSGGNVATERAFVMVAVMLVAVLAERRAITLRAVAVAAVIVLLRRPEELTGPGFQMSFAATVALVAVFAALRRAPWRLPRGLRGVAAVVVSSTVAGLATAPIAAAHFNMVSHYGLIANLASVPVMGAAVMPAAVLAACLWPLGLEGPALWVMEQGLGWILAVAEHVAGLEGAVGHVPAPPARAAAGGGGRAGAGAVAGAGARGGPRAAAGGGAALGPGRAARPAGQRERRAGGRADRGRPGAEPAAGRRVRRRHLARERRRGRHGAGHRRRARRRGRHGAPAGRAAPPARHRQARPRGGDGLRRGRPAGGQRDSRGAAPLPDARPGPAAPHRLRRRLGDARRPAPRVGRRARREAALDATRRAARRAARAARPAPHRGAPVARGRSRSRIASSPAAPGAASSDHETPRPRRPRRPPARHARNGRPGPLAGRVAEHRLHHDQHRRLERDHLRRPPARRHPGAGRSLVPPGRRGAGPRTARAGHRRRARGRDAARLPHPLPDVA